MSLSTPSILLHAFLFLAARVTAATTTTSIPVEHGDDVNTTTFTNISSATTSSPDDADDNKDNFEMYFCFLCSGRDPLLIHHCPIYWDECHLICDDDMATSTTTAPPAPVLSPPPPSLGSSTAAHPMVQEYEDCYVMKLYMSGRYVIVEHRPCKYIAWCFLTCGGGELMADRRKVIMGGSGTRTTAPQPAMTMIQGSFLPAVELCGTQTQVNAPWAPPSPSAGGGGVPAGGAHRRR